MKDIKYLTVHEASAVFGCSDRTIQNAIKKGELKAAYIGKRYLIEEKDFYEYTEFLKTKRQKERKDKRATNNR